jgi:hypothetical protein
MILILGSIVDTIEGPLFDHSMSTRILILIMNWTMTISSINYVENGYGEVG